MNNEEKILQLLLEMQQDLSGLKQDVAELKQDVSDLKQDVAVLQQDVSGIKQTLVAMEAEYGPKITILFDAYELRGDEIGKLEARTDERFDEVQGDVASLFTKYARQDRQLTHLKERQDARAI